MKIFFLCLAVVFSGCSYPQCQIKKLNELTFNNKRCDNEITDIKEFIRPEDTADILRQLSRQNLSDDKEENTLLNILNYVRQIKQINDECDFWQYPKETVLKGGDCEDKTFLLLSMLIEAGIDGAQGVKGRLYGQGHMWVEYKEYILDPLNKNLKLIPIAESKGYTPFFKFDKNNSYYCERSNK